MKKNLALLTAALCFVAGSLMAQTVDDILAKSMKATNYKDPSQKSSYTEMKLSAQGMEMPMKVWSKPVNKVRVETSVMGSTLIMVSDGQKFYMLNPFVGGTEFQEVEQAQFEQMKRQSNVGGMDIYNYKQNGGTVKLLGKEKCGDANCYVLEHTEKDGEVTKIFVDAKSYLISMIRKHVDQNGVNGDLDITVSDYRKVGGMLTPHKMVGTMDGNEIMNMEITKIDYDAQIGDSIFKPEVK
ncbi:MAG: outer membrane lipoprotein-sorting protein [Chloroflexota bacterium]